MNKKRIRNILAVNAILIIFILGCIYIVAKRFCYNIEQMEIRKLDDTFMQVEKLLFRTNIYLTPDTAYFYKLEQLLYNGELPKERAWTDILKNISKGVNYDSDIYSVYTLLADENAHYLLVNGKAVNKLNFEMENVEACLDMDTYCYAKWNKLKRSYLNKVDVLSVYHRYDSINYETNDIVSGYMIINYYRSHILNKINALIGSEETVIFYDPNDDVIVASDDKYLNEAEIRKLLTRDKKGDITLTNGMISSDQTRNLIYNIYQSDNSPFYYVILKEGVEVSRIMTEIRILFLFIIIFFCVATIAYMLMYYNQQHKYLNSLVNVIGTLGSKDESEENTVAITKNKEKNLNIIAKKIIDDNYDINKLKEEINTERRLRTEIEKMYGYAQINSHFLLNSLDTIYWESMKNHGIDNDETKMIEKLCVILKYALDSSNPYISLEEEITCAKNYLAIQQMRKKIRIETEWIIPDSFLHAMVGKLMLQPILENSIQHNQYRDSGKPIHIIIKASLVDDIFSLSISDNGGGMDEQAMDRLNQTLREDKPVNSKHIGLLNVNRRIQLQYGKELGIVLLPARETKGLKVIILLKYITDNDLKMNNKALNIL